MSPKSVSLINKHAPHPAPPSRELIWWHVMSFLRVYRPRLPTPILETLKGVHYSQALCLVRTVADAIAFNASSRSGECLESAEPKPLTFSDLSWIRGLDLFPASILSLARLTLALDLPPQWPCRQTL